MRSQKKQVIVTLKGYGDFVIAANFVNSICNMDKTSKLELVAGNHVVSLAAALGNTEHISFIGGKKDLDVPAIYDIQKRGLVAGLKSILDISRRINQIPQSSVLVFDRLGWRERIIGAGYALSQIPNDSSNIYLAYTRFFKQLGYSLPVNLPGSNSIPSRAIIIPGARMKQRVIPDKTLSQIAKKISIMGIEAKILLLEGEALETPMDISVEVIPRQFTSLIDAIKSTDLVISADSLPAHLSEFFNIPVFVFTPFPSWTRYWLPKSAFDSGGMASFEDIDYFCGWLNFMKIPTASPHIQIGGQVD